MTMKRVDSSGTLPGWKRNYKRNYKRNQLILPSRAQVIRRKKGHIDHAPLASGESTLAQARLISPVREPAASPTLLSAPPAVTSARGVMCTRFVHGKL
jgi:hypothetical protein